MYPQPNSIQASMATKGLKGGAKLHPINPTYIEKHILMKDSGVKDFPSSDTKRTRSEIKGSTSVNSVGNNLHNKMEQF
jgi:hypothetical protein